MNDYTPGLILAWQIAAFEAGNAYHTFIEPEHLFIGLCKLEDFADPAHLRQLGLAESDIALLQAELATLSGLLSRFSLDPTGLRREMRQRIGIGSVKRSERQENTVHRSPQARQVFATADEAAYKAGMPATSVFHLLAALLNWEGIAAWLRQKQVDIAALGEALLATPPPHAVHRDPSMPYAPDGNILERYGKDLTQLAHEGKVHPAIGRKEEMLQIVRTLSRATKNNPLLIGEPGVGKTAVVEGLAWRIAQGNVPDAVRGKRLIQISPADLVAGTSYRGEFEERLQTLIGEVAAASDVVLFIDEIHTIVGAGKVQGGALDAANILKPALARGELRCIGATTRAEYEKYIAKDSALERRFQPITIEEPSPEETLEILRGLQPRFSTQYGLTIADETLQAAVSLALKYLPDRRLPDKAIDLLDEACARTKITRLTISPNEALPHTGGSVAAKTVAEVLSEWTGIPVTQLTEDERARLLKMADQLKERVIGQDEAVEAVAEAVQRARAGLKSPGRPIGVFLFLGPTGVGKTELAKATAGFLFGSDKAITRLDMSEFMEKNSVSRLIGSPPGYVGYEEEGQLTGALRRQPFCMVLLDEIEKAHSDVLNLFLQLFDEGRLADAKGHTVDATNALFIMTSNVGFGRSLGFRVRAHGLDDGLLSELQATFRPEFLNRVDSLIVFKPLHMEHIASIARLILKGLGKRLAEQGLGLHVSDAAIELLARLGYDSQYGARPLRRVIEQHIENPLGGMLLRGEGGEGRTIVVDARGEEVVISLTESSPPG